MAKRSNGVENRSWNSVILYSIAALFCFFYMYGTWKQSGFGKGDRIADLINKKTDCSILLSMNYETHHGNGIVETVEADEFKPCSDLLVDYTPCHDQARAMRLSRENMVYRERHCPGEGERLGCLVPSPAGYVTPFPWPRSRDLVPYVNVPYKSLTVEKAVQNWVQYEGDFLRFPGGGTQFPEGADVYLDKLVSVIPIENGTVRTVLDTGCGVASFGAYLFGRNVIVMSFAPRDSHEAQVQFALERGVPAVIGVFGTIMLPYPSRSFDMAHCSRCLIPWSANDGMYMKEVDRVLRPGGYWVLSGPPINWRVNYKTWGLPEEEVKAEQKKIEETADLLCWEKIYEKGDIAMWRKRENYEDCRNMDSRRTMCEANSSVNVWYKKMESCVTPYPETREREWKPFPERLNVVPSRISSGSVPGLSAETYHEDNTSWKKHVNAYGRVNKLIGTDRYRNILDMNAGLGSFAAAIESPKLWVMNVMPTIAERDTLGVIYERGLIGIYHDWCEAFSTYPRTYDLIHANGVFSLYKDKCDPVHILIEMDRILRPEGAVIFRDEADVLINVRKIARRMKWNTKLVDHEDGPLVSEKVLFAVKRYWVIGEKNSTSSD